MAQFQFDASQVAPQEGIEPVPAGWYNAAVESSELKPTKDGSGAFLECVYVVLDGQYKGRKIYDRFNIRNNNAQAVEIGYRQLSALCHAVGVLQITDSSMLHNRPFKVKVKIRPADGQYEASNDVTARKNINEQVDMGPANAAGAAPWAGGGAPAAPQAPAQPAAQPQPMRPWQQQPPAAQQPQWQPPAAQQPWQGQPQPQVQQPVQQPVQQQPMQPQGQPQFNPNQPPPWAQQPAQ